MDATSVKSNRKETDWPELTRVLNHIGHCQRNQLDFPQVHDWLKKEQATTDIDTLIEAMAHLIAMRPSQPAGGGCRPACDCPHRRR